MLNKIFYTCAWIPSYMYGILKRPSTPLKHLFFSICDHYEPFWNDVDKSTAARRVGEWMDKYPFIAEKFKDSDGKNFNYSFYPEEEYRYEYLEKIAEICTAGFGEVEIHLHHENDNSENLRLTLLDFKNRLADEHGLLSQDKTNGEISYSFVHGNWALDNSRPDGRHCGVNNELDILKETGCYADFTMPSAPDITQTKKINSIYYAVDDPDNPKSHDTGINATIGKKQKGLLMIQGPLTLNFKKRSKGVFPRIENGGIMASNPPSMDRLKSWIKSHIHVNGLQDWGFVKVYTHGTQEVNMKMLFNQDYLEKMIQDLIVWGELNNCDIHFTSAREMANIVFAIEDGISVYDPSLRNYRFKKII